MEKIYLSYFVFILALSCSGIYSFILRVPLTIDQGTLEGTTLATDDGYLYNVYYAIPFATPPVGNLRFKDPQPPQNWEGVRDATTPGPTCFQISDPSIGQFTGDEDCLYLNVYTPSRVYNKSNLAVMVWIHGGAMSMGSATFYDPKFLVEQDVVIVTTNYRPGFTGFMALSNSDVPGNAGLKDLVMALKWVQNNIRHFGGDPDKVTIFGESAGGALTHFLVMSPMATGLFDKAIIQSGASVNEWPIQENHQSVASELVSLVGIHTNNTQDLLEVLLSIPIELVGLVVNQISHTDGRITAFRPVIEGEYSTDAFIRDHPKQLMEKGEFNQVPTMSGFTSQEGVIFLELIDIHKDTVEDIVSDFSFYIPNSIREILTPEEELEVMDKIKGYYFADSSNVIDSFIDINSDQQFIKDIYKSASIFSRYHADTFLYQFLYHGSLNANIYIHEYNYTGAAHGDELGYLFDVRSRLGVTPTEQDWLILRRMVAMWTNFAKYGNPTPELTEEVNVLWKAATEDEMNCLFIETDLSLTINPLQERMQFWRDLEALSEERRQ